MTNYLLAPLIILFFAIGSCTKAFTAVSVGQLADEGKVELNEPVVTYIPWR